MKLTAAVLRKFAEKGMTLQDVIDLAETMEAGFAQPVPELSKAALRTRKWREKQAAEKVETSPRDVTETRHGDGHGDVSPTCTSAQVVKPTSSLRSEGKPPTLPSGASPEKPKPRRSRTVPDGWAPSPETLAALHGLGFTPGEIERELASFRDHEFRDPKSDFDRTFRRWMRQSQNFKPRLVHDRPDDKLTRKQANLTRALDASRRAAGFRGEP